jgi:hypothetical protein
MNGKYNFELFDLDEKIVNSRNSEKRKLRLPLLLLGQRVRTVTEEQAVQVCDATMMKKEQMLITKLLQRILTANE